MLGRAMYLTYIPLLWCLRGFIHICVQSWVTTKNSISSGIPSSWGNRCKPRQAHTDTGMLPGLLSWKRKAKCHRMVLWEGSRLVVHWLESNPRQISSPLWASAFLCLRSWNGGSQGTWHQTWHKMKPTYPEIFLAASLVPGPPWAKCQGPRWPDRRAWPC